MNLCDLTAGNISDIVMVWKKNLAWYKYSEFEDFVFLTQISITFSWIKQC